MSRTIDYVGVFCGSSPGADPAFAEVSRALGHELAGRGMGLVYGGGRVGLMGVIADAVLERGGEAHGVITQALEAKELAHLGLTSLEVVGTMHGRKAAMTERSDAFVMMPGGFGTLDEFLEVLTWSQLGIHAKPCGILNTHGFFDPLLEMFEAASRERFLRIEHRDMLVVDQDPVSLLDRLVSSAPVAVDKWLDRVER